MFGKLNQKGEHVDSQNTTEQFLTKVTCVIRKSEDTSYFSDFTKTAIPVTLTNTTASKISEVSKSTEIIALAPRYLAWSIALCRASSLALSISLVKAVTSPPASDCRPAMNLPPTPLVLAVKPDTNPAILTILKPGTLGEVVTMTDGTIFHSNNKVLEKYFDAEIVCGLFSHSSVKEWYAQKNRYYAQDDKKK